MLFLLTVVKIFVYLLIRKKEFVSIVMPCIKFDIPRVSYIFWLRYEMVPISKLRIYCKIAAFSC